MSSAVVNHQFLVPYRSRKRVMIMGSGCLLVCLRVIRISGPCFRGSVSRIRMRELFVNPQSNGVCVLIDDFDDTV